MSSLLSDYHLEEVNNNAVAYDPPANAAPLLPPCLQSLSAALGTVSAGTGEVCRVLEAATFRPRLPGGWVGWVRLITYHRSTMYTSGNVRPDPALARMTWINGIAADWSGQFAQPTLIL
jgi:hypothetical protein